MESKTYSNRTNARRAGVAAGIPVEQVEITVHKSKGEVRFGFKKADAPAARAKEAAPVVKTEASAPKAKKEPAPKIEREQKNGIKRPSPGGACAAVWDWLDKNPKATAKDAKAALPDFNANNVACEFYQWRKFNGVTATRQPVRRIDGEIDQYAT